MIRIIHVCVFLIHKQVIVAHAFVDIYILSSAFETPVCSAHKMTADSALVLYHEQWFTELKNLCEYVISTIVDIRRVIIKKVR